VYQFSRFSALEPDLNMPDSPNMRCIEITEPGDAGALKLTRRPVPVPGPDEVLIKVTAAGVNRPDVIQRQGFYPAPTGASDIPGLEVSGEIVALGEVRGRTPDQIHWETGQQVCALLTGGGYAEYAIAHRNLCLPVPEGLTLTQAAALPETFFTVWRNIFDIGAIQPEETLLIHGGTSGIGTTAIQLATAFGHTVFATASSEEKCRQCLKLGAKVAINYHSDDFLSVIKEVTDGRGVDVILDMVGGDYVQKNIRAAAFRGRVISIAFLRGSKINLDLMPVMLKELVITGSTLRSRPVEEKSLIARALLDNVWPLIENVAAGTQTAKNDATNSTATIRPLISRTFPLEKAADAHRLMESNQHMGKILLTVTHS
jgi:NADPH2:quinone reductase